MSDPIAPSILDYLGDVEAAVDELASTWRPDDAAYRADVYRQIMMSLSFAYFAYFHADAEHPDWAPLWNPVYTLQPNPDDIYLYAPIRGDLRYRVSGTRGTAHILSFTTTRNMSGMVDDVAEIGSHNDLDDADFSVDADGRLDILFSAERPAGHAGDWARIAPDATMMMVRLRMYDWERETDPALTIECLDSVAPKPRLTPDEIVARIRGMAKFPVRKSRNYYRLQNGVRERVGINRFEPVRYQQALSKQVYWPAIFELDEDEALIVETAIPAQCRYWNIQLNDPYFNAIEYVYRLSSTNGAMATLGADGRFRGVIALSDPGVPNWLDPAGFREGGIYGRWYEADSAPVPTIARVKLADLRAHLPADTPAVTPAARRDEVARRVRAAQRRRRW